MITNFVPEARPSRSIPFWMEAITSAPRSARDDAADAAEEAGAADDGGGDDEQQQVPPPVFVATERSREASMMPPTPAMKPLIMKTAMRTRSTGMPGATRGLGAPAHGVDVAAEARSRGDERPEDQEDDRGSAITVGHAAVLIAYQTPAKMTTASPSDLEQDHDARLRRRDRRPAADARCRAGTSA